MAAYKVIYRKDLKNRTILWEYGCPLLTSAIQITRNTKTAECYLQLKFKNISQKLIGSIKGKVTITYIDHPTEEITLRYLDADIAPRNTFCPDALPIQGSEPTNVEITINQISGSDYEWRNYELPQLLPEVEPLVLTQELMVEREKQITDLGKSTDRLSGHAKDFESWWLCSCGAPNVKSGKCSYCYTPKETIFQLQDETKLKQDSHERAQRQARRNKIIARLLIALAVVIALILAGFAVNIFIVQPELERQKQEQLQKEKEQEEQRLAAIEAESMRRKEAFGSSELIGHIARTTSASDPSTFEQSNLQSGDIYYLYLNADGSCKLSISTAILTDINGTWSISDDGIATISLPDYGGDWSASVSEDGANLVLTNVEDPNVWISFPVEPDSE